MYSLSDGCEIYRFFAAAALFSGSIYSAKRPLSASHSAANCNSVEITAKAVSLIIVLCQGLHKGFFLWTADDHFISSYNGDTVPDLLH